MQLNAVNSAELCNLFKDSVRIFTKKLWRLKMFKRVLNVLLWPWLALAEAKQLENDFKLAHRLQQSEYQHESVAYVLFNIVRKEQSCV